jgi:UDP-N-acetylglucosamine 2-epimerase (non-hydrolysing)
MNKTSNWGNWPVFDAQDIEAVSGVLSSGKVNYWKGEQVANFENEFKNLVGADYAVAVCNGTVSLELILRALKVGAGDEVVVPPRTFIGTATAVVAAGAKPVFADVDITSGNMTMPEEINRLVTDRLSDLLLTPDRLSGENLRREGVPDDRIRFVGNIMIDTLEAQRKKAEKLCLQDVVLANLHKEKKPKSRSDKIDLSDGNIAVLTLHRPSNVDTLNVLQPLVDFFCYELSAKTPLVWSIHPRAEKSLKEFGLWQKVMEAPGITILNPVGYHEMLRLNMAARVMLTDSGGLQEECCVLGTPCLTLRWNTERPITLKEHGGASVLVGNDVERIRKAWRQAIQEERRPVRPELWDGKTAGRIVKAILESG